MRQLAQKFKALSDPTRLGIIGLLLEQRQLCVCDLVAALNLPQSTTSRHLAYLKRTGWLSCRQQGLWMHYALAASLQTDHPGLLAAVSAELAGSPELLEIRRRLESYRSLQAKSC